MEIEQLNLREKILVISRNLLFTSGAGALSMRKIANKVGVSATSIYLHFENKNDLIHTLIEESINELGFKIEQAVKYGKSSIEKLRNAINSYIDFALNNPEKYDIIYAVRPSSMGGYPKEKFRKTRHLYHLLVDVMEEGKTSGMMQLDDPILASYTLWAQLHGVVSVVLSKRLDNRIDKDKFIKQSVNTILTGLFDKNTVS